MSTKDPLFAFFGTPTLATTVLDILAFHGLFPTLIVTAPDKPQGRALGMTPSPVKRWGLEHEIDVITPETLKKEELVAELMNTQWDVFIVAAYGKLIPASVLNVPRRGCLNVHPSLLPKFRGPSPVTSAILADERSTGVSIMQLNERMDEGPVVAQAKVELEPAGWPPTDSLLENILATEGGNLLAEVLIPWIDGEIPAEPQNANQATYTKKFGDTDALIDLTGDPRQNFLKIRAFDANPRAHFFTATGKRVLISQAVYTDDALQIQRVIPEGKKEMGYDDFLRGQKK